MLFLVTDIPRILALLCLAASSVPDPRPASQHLWLKERVSLLVSQASSVYYQGGVEWLHTLSQRSLLPTPGVRCQQCPVLTGDQGWRQGPGRGHQSYRDSRPVNIRLQLTRHNHMERSELWHSTWTCCLKQSIYYTLKSKNWTWTESRYHNNLLNNKKKEHSTFI